MPKSRRNGLRKIHVCPQLREQIAYVTARRCGNPRKPIESSGVLGRLAFAPLGETGDLACAAADQFRVGHLTQNREEAWHDNSADASRHR